MAQTDLKQELKTLYSSSANAISIVDVPPMNFLMVDGSGDPNTSQEYIEALQALYAVAYTAKFTAKRRDPAADYAVMPLEGLWWADNMDAFTRSDKQSWKWTMMIMQPDHITLALIEEAIEEARTKKKGLTNLGKLRLEKYDEGLSAQALHLGPYSAEGPTIERLHTYIREHGYRPRGKHHEIYLGDPRRSAPEKLRTIVRQPVEVVSGRGQTLTTNH